MSRKVSPLLSNNVWNNFWDNNPFTYPPIYRIFESVNLLAFMGEAASGHEINRLVGLLLSWVSNDVQLGSQESRIVYFSIDKGRFIWIRICRLNMAVIWIHSNNSKLSSFQDFLFCVIVGQKLRTRRLILTRPFTVRYLAWPSQITTILSNM